MKAKLVLTFLFLCSTAVVAQRRKSIYAEALGNGIIVSANYDMRLKKNQNDGLGFRAGIGGGSLAGYDETGMSANIGVLTFPLSLNYVVGKKRSGFETGAGFTPIYVSASVETDTEFAHADGLGVTGFLNAGYRFQPINSGVMFRVNWTPAFNRSGFIPGWFGLSLGYSFK